MLPARTIQFPNPHFRFFALFMAVPCYQHLSPPLYIIFHCFTMALALHNISHFPDPVMLPPPSIFNPFYGRFFEFIYESLNVNLRLVLLTRVSEWNSDA